MRKIPTWSRRARRSLGLALVAAAVIAIVPWRLVAQQAQGDGNRGRGEADVAAGGPSSRPAVHPPLHTHDEIDRGAADHNTSHGIWFYDNVVMGRIECPFADVAAGSPGIIVEVRCTEGQDVKQGDPLFAMDDARSRASLQEAEAELKKADINYRRLMGLKRDNAVSPGDVDVAAADRDIAMARLAIAKRELDQTRIRCPMSGVVTKCLTAPGQVVNRGNLLAQIMNVEKLSVAFNVDSAQYPYLRVGQKVRVLSDPAADHPLLATISFLSPVVDQATGKSRVKATIEGADHRPRPGSTVKVDLQFYPEEDLRH